MGPHPFPPPHWQFSGWQKQVWNATRDLSRVRRIWMCCGRGAGKDILAIRCAIRDMLKDYRIKLRDLEDYERRAKAGTLREDEKRPSLNPLTRVWILAPSDHALGQTREDFLGELRGLQAAWGMEEGELFRHKVRDCRYEVFGTNQIHVEYQVTSRPDSMRGPGVDIAIYTEFASETRVAAWRDELPGTLNRVGRLGRVYAYSTPKGPQGLFWEELKGFFGGGSEGESRLVETVNQMVVSPCGLGLYVHAEWHRNELLTALQRELIAAEERANKKSFEQERLAKFVVLDVGGSLVYEEEWLAKNLVASAPKLGRNVLVGVDVARLGDDFTVFAVVDYDSGMLLRVERYAKTTGPEIVAHMERLAMEWGNPEFLMDHTAHQAYIGDFAPRYLRVTGMKIYDREKERLVLNLKFLLQVSRLRVPDPDRFSFRSDAERDAVRELVKEVTQFQKVVNSQGQVRYSAPSGGHDDCLTAWYLAVDPIARDMKGKLDGEKVRSKVAAVL